MIAVKTAYQICLLPPLTSMVKFKYVCSLL